MALSLFEFLEMQSPQLQMSEPQVRDHISASKLNLWLKCPHSYRLRYIEGLKTPPSPSMFFGKCVHEVLDSLYRLVALKNYVGDDENVVAQFVDDAWTRSMQSEPCPFDDDAHETKSRKFSLGAKFGYTDKPPILLDEAKSPFFYICGGASDFDWHKNLHIAFRYKKGSSFEVKTPREHWIIDNAEQIPILPDYIDKNDPHLDDPEFSTCRNFWFASYIKQCLDKEKKKGRLPGFLF